MKIYQQTAEACLSCKHQACMDVSLSLSAVTRKGSAVFPNQIEPNLHYHYSYHVANAKPSCVTV